MALNNMSTNETNMVYVLHVSYGEQIFTAILFGLIAISGLIGNSMIITAVVFSKKLQTSTNAFVTSLSVADLLTSFTLIWFTVSTLGKGEWPIPKAYWLCSFTGFMITACIGISIWTLCAIAVNRLICIVKPVWYLRLYTSWKLAIFVLMPWIIPVSCMLIFIEHLEFGYNKVTLICAIGINTAESMYFVNIVGLLCPLPVIITSYVCIYIHVKKHFREQKQNLQTTDMAVVESGKEGESAVSNSNQATTLELRKTQHISKQQLEITKNLFICVCGFLACFLPYCGLILMRNRLNVEHLIFYVKIGPIANSAMNVMIYAAKHPDFKIVLRHMMNRSFGDIPQPSPILKYLLSKKT